MGYLTRLSSGPFNLFCLVDCPLPQYLSLFPPSGSSCSLAQSLELCPLLSLFWHSSLPKDFHFYPQFFQLHRQLSTLRNTSRVTLWSSILAMFWFLGPSISTCNFSSRSAIIPILFPFQSYLKQNYMKKKKQKVGSGRRVGRYLSRRHHNKFCWCLGEKKIHSSTVFKTNFPMTGHHLQLAFGTLWVLLFSPFSIIFPPFHPPTLDKRFKNKRTERKWAMLSLDYFLLIRGVKFPGDWLCMSVSLEMVRIPSPLEYTRILLLLILFLLLLLSFPACSVLSS